MGEGWTTARADQGPPSRLATVETTCGGAALSGQKRQAAPSRRPTSGASPVITQERVIGSLRNSIALRKHPPAAGVNGAGFFRRRDAEEAEKVRLLFPLSRHEPTDQQDYAAHEINARKQPIGSIGGLCFPAEGD